MTRSLLPGGRKVQAVSDIIRYACITGAINRRRYWEKLLGSNHREQFTEAVIRKL
jgi:hypothetical protein